MSSVKIGISLGDPGGIGPEVTLKALFSFSNLPKANYILFGPRSIIEKETNKYDLKNKIPDYDPKKTSSLSQITLYDIPYPLNSLKYGYPCKENGVISFNCFKNAVKEAKKGSLDAVVTSPISKESWKLAGINWAGHTEYLCQEYPEAIMSFFSKNLNVALFTHHMALKKALKKVNKKDLIDFFISLDRFSQKSAKKRYHLLVPGLNPHAGENGLMGKEEITEIAPAVHAAKEKGVHISGPFPPDTIFRKAYKDSGKIVASLYHDQGLIPFKIVSFNEGVNVTLGLPFVRTSPDHGTAFDIVGKGTADPNSMLEAIKLAVRFSRNQHSNE
jgi:4-hydroxythreonine-4-phosphate dehydrogenase